MEVTYSDITDSIQALAGLATLYLAYLGLSAWRTQLKNTEDHSLARDLLRASFNLRDGLNLIRNPFMYVNSVDEKGNQLDENGRHQEVVKIYQERLREAGRRRVDLEVKITEGEAL